MTHEGAHFQISLRAPPNSQNLDYTSRRNILAGRHGWFRLTPAYSVQLVEELLGDVRPGHSVLDPFGGTGTTALCAAMRGVQCTSVEINPFLAWLAGAKLSHYSRRNISIAREIGSYIAAEGRKADAGVSPIPPMRNVEKWWGAEQLNFLQRLKSAIGAQNSIPVLSRVLIEIAFCKTVVEIANIDRGHTSLSLHKSRQLSLDFDNASVFEKALDFVATSAADNPIASATIMRGDARDLSAIEPGSVDLVVTSPPYPNRVTVIRELRPIMYWLDMVDGAGALGELDWRSIGGTWGVATSRLRSWKIPARSSLPIVLLGACREIEETKEYRGKPIDSTGARMMANYVRKYFADIQCHLKEIRRLIRNGGHIRYVIGNASFYGVVVEADKVFVEMLEELGFRQVTAKAIRKRASKKELYEFVISAIG